MSGGFVESEDHDDASSGIALPSDSDFSDRFVPYTQADVMSDAGSVASGGSSSSEESLDEKLMTGIYDALTMAHLTNVGVSDFLAHLGDYGGSPASDTSVRKFRDALKKWTAAYENELAVAESQYPAGGVPGEEPDERLQQRGAERVIKLLRSQHSVVIRYVMQTGVQSESLSQVLEGTLSTMDTLKVLLRKSIARIENEEVWEMTLEDKMDLQFTWIGWFFASILGIYLYIAIAEALTHRPSEESPRTLPPSASPHPHTQNRQGAQLINALWSGNRTGVYINFAIIVISLLNFYCYMQLTEFLAHKDEYIEDKEAFEKDPAHEQDPGKYTPYIIINFGLNPIMMNDIVELLSAIFFTGLAILRLYLVPLHPQWKDFGWTAIPRYAIANCYMFVELISLVVSWRGFMIEKLGIGTDSTNLLWLHLVRSLEMLELSGHGLGVRKLKTLIDEERMMLITSYVIGLIIWLVLSALYFCANVGNEDLMWEAAAYDGELWFRFESIPATSFFCLINLLKEHPLADKTTGFWARVWVDVSVLFAMPLFALGTSILQYALFKTDDDREEPYRSWIRGGDSDLTLPSNRRKAILTGALAFLTIERFVSFTARDAAYSLWFGLEFTKSSASGLAFIDGAVAVAFLLEYAFRVSRGGKSYAFTALAAVDLVSWLPGLLHILIYFGTAWTIGAEAFERNPWGEWLRACCVLRVFKLERFFRSLADLGDIVWQRRSILGATFLLCMLTWMFFSHLLYLSDGDNPDMEVRENYSSVMRSLWSEIINLHGEYPWADYTARGKPVMMFIGIFSVMIFCVPTSIFSDGFMERLNQDIPAESMEIFDRRPWQTGKRPETPSNQRRIYDKLYLHLHSHPREYTVDFKLIRAANLLLVTASTLITLVSTMQDSDFCAEGETSCTVANTVRSLGFIVDAIALPFFAFDLALRAIALGSRHIVSLVGCCDVLSLLALAMSLHPSVRRVAFHPKWDASASSELLLNLIVPLRLLRLFSLDSYFQSGHVLMNVFYAYRWPLIKAGGALLHLWLVHATLLYLIERPGGLGEILGQREFEMDEENDPKMWTMRKRYCDMPRSLQYSLIHLFGDFPETEYTFWAKVVHFVGIVYGIGIDAAFIGVVSSGFAHYLQVERRQRAKQVAMDRFVMATRVVIRIQGWWKRRQQRLAAIAMVQDPDSRRRLLRKSYARSKKVTIWTGITLGAREITFNKNWGAGKLIRYFFHCVLLFNLVITMLISLPELELPEFHHWEEFGLTAEFLCSLTFTAQYILATIAAPKRALSFFRVVDFICLWPGFALCYCVVVRGQRRLPGRLEALAMLRAVRILDFGFFQKEVTFIKKAMKGSARLLATPAYLAMTIWITTSSLFMFLENMYSTDLPHGQAEIMTSVPASMYWCCILLIGEWAVSDFTYAGGRLCIFYVLFGIALFAIPAGIMIEEIQNAMVLAQDETNKMKEIWDRTDKHEREAVEKAEVELRQVTTDLMSPRSLSPNPRVRW